MNKTDSVSAEGFTLDLSRRVLEPEEVISGEEAVAYANRRDNRLLSSKLIAFDIVEKLSLTSTSNVLEVACGTGQLAYELQQLISCSITATDGSPELISVARERYEGPRLEFRAENLRGHSGILGYDALVCKDSFHHFFESKWAIAEMVGLVKPGGKIYIFDLCRDASVEEVERRRSAIKSSHEQMRFLRSLNASLSVAEFRAVCEGFEVSALYPLKFSKRNLRWHTPDIHADTMKEFRLSTLFSVYVIDVP